MGDFAENELEKIFPGGSKVKCKLNASDFKRIIDNTKKFTRIDVDKMQYIHLVINAEKQTIRAEALDGYKVSIEYAKIAETDCSFECYIKPIIPKITKRDEFVELELDNNRLFIIVGDTITGYVQPEGDFYDLDRVVSDATKTEPVRTIGVDQNLLKDALDATKNSGYYRPLAKIEIRNPNEAIVIRSGGKDIEENIKMVLPIKINK